MKRVISSLFFIPFLFNCSAPHATTIKLKKFIDNDNPPNGQGVNNFLESDKLSISANRKYDFIIDLKDYFPNKNNSILDEDNYFFFSSNEIHDEEDLIIINIKVSGITIKVNDKDLTKVDWHDESEELEQGTFTIIPLYYLIKFKLFSDTTINDSIIKIESKYDNTRKAVIANYCYGEIVD